MDNQTGLWLGLFLTIIIGLPGAYVMGVLGNLHIPRWTKYLQSRKLLKHTKSKQQAVLLFKRIKAFHEGTRDRYPFYILLATTAVICIIVASALILIIFIQNHDFPFATEYVLAGLFAFLLFLVAIILLTGLYETARQLERFDDYKAEFEARWGQIDNGP